MLDGYCTEKVQKANKKWTQLSNENPSHNRMCFGIIENTPMKNFNTHQWTVARLRPGWVCCVHAASSLLGEEYRPATTQRLTMHQLQRELSAAFSATSCSALAARHSGLRVRGGHSALAALKSETRSFPEALSAGMAGSSRWIHSIAGGGGNHNTSTIQFWSRGTRMWVASLLFYTTHTLFNTPRWFLCSPSS